MMLVLIGVSFHPTQCRGDVSTISLEASGVRTFRPEPKTWTFPAGQCHAVCALMRIGRGAHRSDGEVTTVDIEVRLLLSGEDLARLTVLGAADPLTEVQSAAHRLAFGRAIDAPAATWARRTASVLGPTGALIMDVLGSGLAVCSDLGQHLERFTVEFDDFADSIRRVPPRIWESEVDSLLDWGIPPGRPGEMANDRRRIDQFATVIDRFQQAAVRPYWPVISATVAAHSDAVAQRLAIGGPDAVLNSLHPSVTWEDPILTITGDRSEMCAPHCAHKTISEQVMHAPPQPLDGRGLTLVPSVLTTDVSVFAPEEADADDRPWELSYPVPWNWTVRTDVHRHALAALMGATRAAVLDSLLGRILTTSELARGTHISPASASEHASVLRTAGLLTSTRERSRVYHRLTPVGIALATGGSDVTFTGTVADQIAPSGP
jgi:DNA-binding transcriptional ArsR family regulator